MSNIKNNAASQETRRKLISAAGEVFAERGFHAATILEITERAGVNTAAINYHFRDKSELYAAVVRHALSLTPVVPAEEDAKMQSPEDRLRADITNMIHDLYGSSRPAWSATLLAHEFAQPTAALDAVIEELIRPRCNGMNSIVRDILGPNASETQVLRCGLSVGSQGFLYVYQREIVRRLHPELAAANSCEELIEHIVTFSLAALHAMRKKIEE